MGEELERSGRDVLNPFLEIHAMLATTLALFLIAQASPVGEAPPRSEAAAEYGAFVADWDRHAAKFRLDHAAASTEEARKKVQKEYLEVVHSLGKRALAFIGKHPREPEALDSLLWMTRNALRPESSEAWKILIRDHLASNRIVPACFDTRRDVVANTALVERFLREVIASSPHREVRGQASYALANVLNFQAEALQLHQEDPRDSLIAKMPPEDRATFMARRPEALLEEAETLYGRVIADFADLKDIRNRLLGELARGELNEMHNLGVEKVALGTDRKPAPDIEGEDADGKAFKLSDYRGKVVLLTFSGNWCGPCRAMYPEERELVKSLKGKPFALLSVNTDKDRATLKKSIETGEVTWRCWWDGEPGGPISTRWGVEGYPTIYLIDQQGAIRAKALGQKSLKEAVETLLAEMETKPSR